MLLRFRVSNHRSIHEEQELSLVEPPRRGARRLKASEIPPTLKVAGIYGANASGKSNILKALRWMRDAVRDSHTHWQPNKGVPRDPFQLTAAATADPSFHEVDFVVAGVRHTYGFEADDTAIVGEWLFNFPHGRPQRLFERDEGNSFTFGRALTGQLRQIEQMTRENSLYLSTGASNNHEKLRHIHSLITDGIEVASQREISQSLNTLTEFLIEDSSIHKFIIGLTSVADLGISDMSFKERNPEDIPLEMLESLEKDKSIPEEALRSLRKVVSRELVFTHDGADPGRTVPFGQESDGTRSWFAILGPLLQVLRDGKVFLVDEIDSSLHPVISSSLIKMFKDPDVNPKGAQLIFASHDTTLLGSMLQEKLLSRHEVWFTEKERDGMTHLFSLEEFRTRGEENIERGYLQGRYGAVPFIDFNKIRQLFQDLRKENGGSSTRQGK